MENEELSSLSPVSSRAARAITPAEAATITNGDQLSPPQTLSSTDQDAEMIEAPAPVELVKVVQNETPSEASISQHPKRKRASTYREEVQDDPDNDAETVQDDDTTGDTSAVTAPSPPAALPGLPSRIKRHGNSNVKGVVIGSWRDSSAPTRDQKHAVIGFIDIRDRLRTRIQPTDMTGNAVDLSKYPIPAGPGGSWVTFGSVHFENHLVGLDQFQVKEFVKIRSDVDPDETPEEKISNDKRAVKDAIRRVAMNPPPETPGNSSPAIAYGDNIPASVREVDDMKKKRRKLGSGAAQVLPQQHSPTDPQQTPPVERVLKPAPAVAGASKTLPQPHELLPSGTLNNLPGTRPTKVYVGSWAHSSEEKAEDRHAVYGIIGVNDMFRVKVVRETKDGRYVDGNFPPGAGALWITYDQVKLDDQLKDLSRAEVKEYVRFRQYQIDRIGENDETRCANIQEAIRQARTRWAAFEKKGEAIRDMQEDDRNGQSAASSDLGSPYFSNTQTDGHDGALSTRESFQGTRHSSSIMKASHTVVERPVPDFSQPPTKLDGRTKAGRLAKQQALAAASARREAEAAAAAGQMGNRPIEPRPTTRSRRDSNGADAIERTNHLAQREIARAEALAQREERHESRRATMPASQQQNLVSGAEGTAQYNSNIERLDKVWQRQEATRINKYGAEDAIFHAGIKYERRPTGHFAGKLSSHPVIINIDGEDYVEYRVLLKPSW